MQTFLAILLVAFVGCVLVYAILYYKNEKAWNLCIARASVGVLMAHLRNVRREAEKPENAKNAKWKALLQRVETAHAQAKAALDAGNYKKVESIAEPVLSCNEFTRLYCQSIAREIAQRNT